MEEKSTFLLNPNIANGIVFDLILLHCIHYIAINSGFETAAKCCSPYRFPRIDFAANQTRECGSKLEDHSLNYDVSFCVRRIDFTSFHFVRKISISPAK